MDDNIYVTRPDLPPLEEFIESLKRIWQSRWLTNMGEFHNEFENSLRDYLGVRHISLLANGTLALIIALRALRVSGDVVTTPFSFVATTHALHWSGMRPIFCDIEDTRLTIDPQKIEALLTPKTSAILAVHVYGFPCYTEEINHIAKKHGLRIIYDAAHAFGVSANGRSVLNSGDLSVLSFHATKVFNSIEGGAIVSPDGETKKTIDLMKNFGILDEVTVVGPGINAKMNEVISAFGLLQMKYIDSQIKKRKSLVEIYRAKLDSVRGIKIFRESEGVKQNYCYFPVLIQSPEFPETRDELFHRLRANHIYPRRYFYPLISQFPPYHREPSASKENLPVAEKIAHEILCLPLYADLSGQDVERIANVILGD